MRYSRAMGMLATAIIALPACEGSGNPAAGVNAALAEYIQAQGTYGQTDANISESTVTLAWVDEKSRQLQQMRSTFEVLRSEAEAVDFPEEAGERGQPAQATVDEYLAATDAYITANEQQHAQIKGCLSAGGTPYNCAMQVGTESLLGIYPDVVKRAQAAAMQLQAESSRG
jgi:hypothetical protein